MPTTVPNQKIVQIHREPLGGSFLGINNDNWKYAARVLGAQAFLLTLACHAQPSTTNSASWRAWAFWCMTKEICVTSMRSHSPPRILKLRAYQTTRKAR